MKNRNLTTKKNKNGGTRIRKKKDSDSTRAPHKRAASRRRGSTKSSDPMCGSTENSARATEGIKQGIRNRSSPQTLRSRGAYTSISRHCYEPFLLPSFLLSWLPTCPVPPSLAHAFSLPFSCSLPKPEVAGALFISRPIKRPKETTFCFLLYLH